MDETDAKRRGSSISGSSGSLSAPDLPAADSPATASKSLCLAALGVGALGVIIGITGIVMANGASAELAALKTKVEQTQDPQTVLKAKFDDIDERIGAASADALRANNGVRDAVQQISKAIAADREQINKNTAAISGHKLAAPKAVSPNVPAAASEGKAEGKAEAAAPATSTNASGQKTHTVAAGDYFYSIAKQYGTTVAAIEDANPGIDSKHLKIGQQIVIPSGSAPAPAAVPAKAEPAPAAAPAAATK